MNERPSTHADAAGPAGAGGAAVSVGPAGAADSSADAGPAAPIDPAGIAGLAGAATAAAEPVLAARGLCKAFGAVRVADDVSLDLRPGEIHALIGPNGAGKSSLVAQIAGALRPDAGTVTLGGRVLASGAPEAIRADARVRAAYLGEAAELSFPGGDETSERRP